MILFHCDGCDASAEYSHTQPLGWALCSWDEEDDGEAPKPLPSIAALQMTALAQGMDEIRPELGESYRVAARVTQAHEEASQAALKKFEHRWHPVVVHLCQKCRVERGLVPPVDEPDQVDAPAPDTLP